MRRLGIAALLGALAGCAAPPPTCTSLPGRASIVADLYFGRAPVTDTAWKGFLADTVTPRFPAGLTVLDASGQWQRQDDGRIVSERSSVLRIVTDGDAETMRRLEEIRTAYRGRFAQESVGLVTTPACASF